MKYNNFLEGNETGPPPGAAAHCNRARGPLFVKNYDKTLLLYMSHKLIDNGAFLEKNSSHQPNRGRRSRELSNERGLMRFSAGAAFSENACNETNATKGFKSGGFNTYDTHPIMQVKL